MSERTALLLGATGLVGGHLLTLLRADPHYRQLTLLVRRPLGLADAKVREQVIDWGAPASWEDAAAVDDVFCCLGTTLKQAGSEAAFRKVDLEYPVEVARRARAGGAKQYLICTAVGADPKSRIFYNRTKGECEAQLRALDFPEGLRIFHPSLLLGERKESRSSEVVASALMRATGFLMLGGLRRYRAIEAQTVARAMQHAATTPAPGVKIYEGEALFSAGLAGGA